VTFQEISVRDLAWIAGILEGEGSFGWRKSNPSAYVCCVSTDLDVLVKLHNFLHFGGICRSKSTAGPVVGSKTCYRWQIAGKRALGLMMTIYPFMGQRRQSKIRDVLEKWKEHPHNKNHKLSPQHSDLQVGDVA